MLGGVGGPHVGNPDLIGTTRPAASGDLTLVDESVRNALLAGIGLANEFPILNRVWERLLAVTAISTVLEDAGGVVQPFTFDAERFEVYVENMPGPSTPADENNARSGNPVDLLV